MRLIDADALMEKAYWHGERPDVGNPFAEGVEAVDVSDIEEAPTIEAEPVRHGRWVTNNRGFAECTECKFERIGIPLVHRLNYCPNCGAKMEG